MSQYETEYRGESIACPYCGFILWEIQDYLPKGQRTREEVWECPACSKRSHLSICVEIPTRTRPDCMLNGGEHKLVNLECSVCSCAPGIDNRVLSCAPGIDNRVLDAIGSTICQINFSRRT